MFKSTGQQASKNNTNPSAIFQNGRDAKPFIQPKLKVGKPGDKYEVEADKTADAIVANGQEAASSPSFFVPATNIQRQPEEETKALQEKPLAASISSGIQLMFDRDKDVQEKEEEDIQRKEEETEVQKKDSTAENPSDTSNLESQLNSSKGGGTTLSGNTKSEMESGFGTDFSGVRVHTDSNAVQMSQGIGAQAFTHGNDIYFNEGKYDTQSDSGKHLLAHELTHTVQQGASVQPKLIQKTETEGSESSEDSEDILDTFKLPAVKARHLPLYQAWAASGRLKRFKSYSRDSPNQISVWKNYLWDKMQNTDHLNLPEDFTAVKKIGTPGGKEISGRRATLLKKLTVPNWDREGNVLKHTFEVDHIIELQTGGWPNANTANDIENMELLDKRSNSKAGSKTRGNISRTVRNYLEATEQTSSSRAAKRYLRENTVDFEEVELGQGDFAGDSARNIGSKYWTRIEIEQGQHLGELTDLGNIDELGSPTELALMSSDDGFLMTLFPHAETILEFAIDSEDSKSKAVAGLTISNISLNNGYEDGVVDTNIGNITASWDLPSEFQAPADNFQIPLVKSESQYAVKIGLPPPLSLDFRHFSPIDFGGEYGINEDGLFATGSLTPSLEFLEGASIQVGIRGTEVYFVVEYVAGDINLPIPGVEIDDSTLWAEYSSETGFAIGGLISFTLSKIGRGSIEGGFGEGDGLYLRGEIQFDEELFGGTQASARMAYENDMWSIGGTLIIPEDRIRGIKSATIEANYSESEGFLAAGEAEMDIPGIERGSMSVEYGENGFAIAGEFDISSDVPGIQGGHVQARVAKEEGAENYDVFVQGTAQPAIPGIDTQFTVTYENGAITISGEAAYSRGMLSGDITVGATNRTIGDDGQPTGDPDDTMRVYGRGELTLQLTPWLEATAGVEFMPNGEIEIMGRIGLPDTVDIFDRREINRNLFSVPTVEIPLFAIPLGPRSLGLVAQINGGLAFTAGFGPGQLRNVFAEVSYNPDHEEQTQIHGHGEFAIPADAGLTLSADLGLGLSVGIASLTGGIELTGTLGLGGEAVAEVDLGWNPQTGIALHAEGSITVNPVFSFGINALARATLGVGFLSISEEWREELTSFNWGPDIEFGIVFPVDYQENEPFDISVDDVEVIYPDLDVVDMAKDLATDIKDRIF